MADIKISEMIEAMEVDGEEYVPIVQNQTNKKVKLSKMQSNKIEKNTVYNGDLNDINDTCFHYADSDCTNRPTNINGYVFTQKLNNDWMYQLYRTYKGEETWERFKYNGVWGEWKSKDIITTTNGRTTAIKFPDGTMIQRGYVNCGTAGAGAINFQPNFIDTDITMTASEKYTGSNGLGVIVTTQSDNGVGGAVYFRKYVNGVLTIVTDTTIQAHWTAIGRWK